MTANVEPWPPNDAGERLRSTRFNDVRWSAETGSTNADLLQAAAAGLRGPVVLVTDHQTAGRGRQRRTWYDEPGDSLLVSVLVAGHPAWAGLIPLATGLAALGAVESVLGVEPARSPVGLKWPNDVLAAMESELESEPKLAGILVESRIGGASGASSARAATGMAVVIGMGVNLRWSVEPPTEVRERGITLEIVNRRLHGTPLPPSARNDLLVEYLIALDAILAELARTGGPEAVLAHYRTRCLTIGRTVSFDTSEGPVVGNAIDVGPEGELLVTDGGGRLHHLVAGDAHHRPPEHDSDHEGE
jgi:BirA family biotin operon repressor/biotin-[acetyl-CoA-carboxylase] ligase